MVQSILALVLITETLMGLRFNWLMARSFAWKSWSRSISHLGERDHLSLSNIQIHFLGKSNSNFTPKVLTQLCGPGSVLSLALTLQFRNPSSTWAYSLKMD